MAARATTEKTAGTSDGDAVAAAPRVRRPSWRERLRARLRDDYEEDGVFRPVRLSLWTDLAISGAIVLVVLGGFAAFFVWLAQTRVR